MQIKVSENHGYYWVPGKAREHCACSKAVSDEDFWKVAVWTRTVSNYLKNGS
jgi:hypothetical protein